MSPVRYQTMYRPTFMCFYVFIVLVYAVHLPIYATYFWILGIGQQTFTPLVIMEGTEPNAQKHQ
jgi:hypothetical protein